MATLYTQQSSNVRKTWLLVSVFLVIIIGLGWGFSYFYNSPVILYGAVVVSMVMNIVSFWYSDKIVLSMSGAKPATREEYFDLYTVTENLAITAGLPTPKLYVITDPAPNAFATGRNKDHSAVAVTTGLLEKLNRTELEGVIAHELAHVGNRDILLQTVVVILVGCVSLLSDLFLRSMVFGRGSDERDGRLGLIIAIAGFVLAILSPIVATLIQLAISRKREFLADATGALLTRYPEGLASALEKISAYGAPMCRASDATAHMFIANPFGGKSVSGLHKLFMTHPPAAERIKALRELSV